MDVMAPFTYFITSRLHVEETEIDIMVRQNKKKEGGGGHSEAISFFFFHLQHFISFLSQRFFLSFYLFPLDLSPGSFHLMICGTHIVYSVLDWTLLEKNTPVSTDLMQERECEILLWKSSCTRLLKFTRKTRHSNTETLLRPSVCPCTHTHAHSTAHVMNGVHSNVQTHTHTHKRTHSHAHTLTYM